MAVPLLGPDHINHWSGWDGNAVFVYQQICRLPTRRNSNLPGSRSFAWVIWPTRLTNHQRVNVRNVDIHETLVIVVSFRSVAFHKSNSPVSTSSQHYELFCAEQHSKFQSKILPRDELPRHVCLVQLHAVKYEHSTLRDAGRSRYLRQVCLNSYTAIYWLCITIDI